MKIVVLNLLRVPFEKCETRPLCWHTDMSKSTETWYSMSKMFCYFYFQVLHCEHWAPFRIIEKDTLS